MNAQFLTLKAFQIQTWTRTKSAGPILWGKKLRPRCQFDWQSQKTVRLKQSRTQLVRLSGVQVRARQLGRKWVLRACGRALFREIGRRWAAGEMKYDSPSWQRTLIQSSSRENERTAAQQCSDNI